MATIENFNQHISNQEAEICNRIITAAFAAGCEIQLNDGEEISLEASTSRDAIQAETCITDQTYYGFREIVTGRYIGWVWLVHGNGADLISDYNDTPQMNALLQPVMDYAQS